MPGPLPLARLRQLDFLRGFVAVGRRLSVTGAADELALTQSAVSRQVQALEEALGVKLLHRGHRSVALTSEGERLFSVADAALRQLQEVMGALAGASARLPVTVTASVGVTGLWLLPRLAALQAAHPEVDLRVAASDRVLDLRAEGIDIALRYAARRPEPGAQRLFDERLVAVAHPSLRVRGKPLGEVIERHVLLEFDGPRRPWLQWSAQLRQLGLERLAPRGVLRFNRYDQIVHAALAGQGLALGRRPLVEPMLADGRLCALGDEGALRQPEQAYWLLLADEAPRAGVAAVAAWIREAAGSGGGARPPA